MESDRPGRAKINSSDPPLTAVCTAYPTEPLLPFTPDGTPALVRVHRPLRPTTAAATHYPAVAAAIVRIIAESATALAQHKAGGL